MPDARAAVVHPGSGTFTWEDVQLEDPRPDELLVRVVGTGICHTDLATRDEHLHTPMPAVLGHEGAGVVEVVGDGVVDVAPGDKVLLSFSSCGHCSACQHGHPAHSVNFIPMIFVGARPDGTTPIRSASGEPLGGRFFGQSSFATRCIAHVRSVVPVEALDEDELALLAPIGCGVQTGAGAVLNELAPGTGDTIAIFGAGAVGLSGVMAAALTPAEHIIAIDIVPSRLDLARELGATHVINGKEEDTAERLADITKGRGLTHALESSGVPALLRQATDALAVGGSVAVVGPHPWARTAPTTSTSCSTDAASKGSPRATATWWTSSRSWSACTGPEGFRSTGWSVPTPPTGSRRPLPTPPRAVSSNRYCAFESKPDVRGAVEQKFAGCTGAKTS